MCFLLCALLRHVHLQPDSDPAGEVQEKVLSAIANGDELVQIEPGEYHFGNRTFSVEDASNLRISTRGPTTFWFSGAEGGIVLRRCNNVTFSGFTLDRSPPPWIQAKAVSVNGSSVLFEIPAGFVTSIAPWFSTGKNAMDQPLSYHYSTSLAADDGLPLLSPQQSAGVDLNNAQWLSPRQFLYNVTYPFAVGDHVVVIMWQGFNYVVANSSHCVTEDLTVRASGYIAVTEIDGKGAHVYRNVTIRPGDGRLIASTADGFHSTDVDKGPLLENCHFRRLLDDYFNFQNSLLLVMNVSVSSAPSPHAQQIQDTHTKDADDDSGRTVITVVHPHTNDQLVDGRTDLFYGTSEPLQRMRKGDKLRFFDPVTFEHLDDIPIVATPTQVPSPKDSDLGRQADALFDIISKPPYHLPSFEPERYRMQHFRSSVYWIALTRPPPVVPSANGHADTHQMPYVVESGRSRCHGATVTGSHFAHSTGLFGRWKSSDSALVNNTFAHTTQLNLELEMIPSFYEGSVLVNNFTMKDNRFIVPKDAKATHAAEFLWAENATQITVEGNIIDKLE